MPGILLQEFGHQWLAGAHIISSLKQWNVWFMQKIPVYFVNASYLFL
jgi:hypothetical protein